MVTTVDPKLKHIAVSSRGYIKLRPDFFQLPRVKQLFIYAHECGHQVHGESESAADCYAVKMGRSQKWLTLERLTEIVADQWDPRDWTHAPGYVRGQQMLACYKTP
jgi:hypothetical protein